MTKTKLQRTTFSSSRFMEFGSEKELVNQTGHARDEWPRVVLKELTDNALDYWKCIWKLKAANI